MKALDSLMEKYGDDLNGLVDMFRSSGLGDKVESWIGTGQNEEITPEEIKQGFGQDEIDRIAQQSGKSSDEVANELSRELPRAVDEVTPTARSRRSGGRRFSKPRQAGAPGGRHPEQHELHAWMSTPRGPCRDRLDVCGELLLGASISPTSSSRSSTSRRARSICSASVSVVRRGSLPSPDGTRDRGVRRRVPRGARGRHVHPPPLLGRLSLLGSFTALVALSATAAAARPRPSFAHRLPAGAVVAELRETFSLLVGRY